MFNCLQSFRSLQFKQHRLLFFCFTEHFLFSGGKLICRLLFFLLLTVAIFYFFVCSSKGAICWPLFRTLLLGFCFF